MRITNPIAMVRASFGYKLDAIKYDKNNAGTCAKVLLNFLILGELFRVKYFMILVLKSFFSFFIPPSTSGAGASLSL